MSKYRNTVFYDYQSRFLVIFSSNDRHRLALKIPFLDHIFSKNSKYWTKNLYFPSTGKYYAPPPLLPRPLKCLAFDQSINKNNGIMSINVALMFFMLTLNK